MNDDTQKNKQNPQNHETLDYDEKVDIVVYEDKHFNVGYACFCRSSTMSWAFHVVDAGLFITIPVIGCTIGSCSFTYSHWIYLYVSHEAKIILPLRERLSLLAE